MRVQLRAHQPQRLGDAVDRPAADRVVAVERERAPLLGRQPAGQQAQQRARVADVDRPVGLARLAQAGAADHDLALAHLHERAERAHGLERGGGVGGVQVVLDPHRLARPSPRAAPRGGRSTCPPGRSAVPCRPLEGSKRMFTRARHRKAEVGDQLLRAGRRAARRRPTARRRPGGCPRRATAPCRRCSRPPGPSASASSAITPGRLGTEARSSRTACPPTPPISPAPSSASRSARARSFQCDTAAASPACEARAHLAQALVSARRCPAISASRLDR